MPGPDSLSPWATLVLMLPFGVLLAMSMFGVDERLAAPKAKRLRARFCEVGADGRAELTDPDGSGWRPRRLERGVGAQGSNRLDAGSLKTADRRRGNLS